jgi:uncharacterized protein (DUF2141 family)
MRSFFLFCGLLLIASVGAWAQSNAIPFVEQPLVPMSAVPGGPGFNLTVNGTGFVSASTVNWNGTARPTQFESTTRLTAAIAASEIAKAGAASVTVVNPSPGGGISSPVWFEITAPTSNLGFFSRADYLSETVQSVFTGDFNGDGIPDLAVAIGCFNSQNCDTGGVTILLGNADGTFLQGQTYAAGLETVSITGGDFNGDGKLDLAVVNENCQFFNCPAGEISILLGNGDGTFQNAVNFSTGIAPVAIITADLNGDGKLDLVTANNCGYSCNSGPGDALSVLLGNGDGTFQPSVEYHLTDLNNAVGVAAGDVNGDGKLDLVAVDYCASRTCNGDGSLLSILLGNGDGTFQAPTNVPTDNYPSAAALADINGDGKLDMVVAVGGLVIAGATRGPLDFPGLSNPGYVAVLLGNGDGTFEKGVEYDTGSQPAAIAVGDFNGDGKLDVATSNLGDLSATSGTASILLGNGDGTLQGHIDYPAAFAPQALAVSDFNRDGRLDLVTANQGGSVSVLLQTLVQISPSTVTFPVAILLGQTSTALPVRLTNLGMNDLHISGIAITGTNRGDFKQRNDCGQQLAPNASCLVEMELVPTAPGLRTAALTIADDAPGGQQMIQLQGQGTIISFSPAALNFGSQAVGTSSPPETTTMTNDGVRSVRIFHAISIDGPDAKDFSQTHTCGNSLSGGQSCGISVTFTPKAQGSRAAWITVYDDGGGSPQRIALSGTGT